MKTPIKRLFLDIETSPNVVYSWRVGYKINIDYENILEERSIICIGYKFEGENKVHSLQWDGRGDDKAMIEKFIPILESADEVVAHFGDKFDLPWIRARAAHHGLLVNPEIKSIDTKSQSSRVFYFNSNRLDYLAQFLGIGKKIETDFKLWKDVMSGSKKALTRMVDYCKHDVELLEQVYLKLEGYNRPKTHAALLRDGSKTDCPYCASTKTERRGFMVSASGVRKQRRQCKSCGKWATCAIMKGEN